MESLQVQAFEDRRWSSQDQALVWRHEVGLELVTEEPVLDVGAGDGLFLPLIQARKGFNHLTLLDVSPIAVEKAHLKGLEARVADITRPFPFPDKSFGTACALDVLEHLYDPLPTLREMARVCPMGRNRHPYFHYWKDRVQMLGGRVPFQCMPKRGHVHWFNFAMLQEIIVQAGLQVEVIVFGGLRRLGPVGTWLANYRPHLFVHSFAVLMRTQ